jgi:hypothetical protein
MRTRLSREQAVERAGSIDNPPRTFERYFWNVRQEDPTNKAAQAGLELEHQGVEATAVAARQYQQQPISG